MFQSTALDSAFWQQKPKCNGYTRQGVCHIPYKAPTYQLVRMDSLADSVEA